MNTWLQTHACKNRARDLVPLLCLISFLGCRLPLSRPKSTRDFPALPLSGPTTPAALPRLLRSRCAVRGGMGHGRSLPPIWETGFGAGTSYSEGARSGYRLGVFCSQQQQNEPVHAVELPCFPIQKRVLHARIASVPRFYPSCPASAYTIRMGLSRNSACLTQPAHFSESLPLLRAYGKEQKFVDSRMVFSEWQAPKPPTNFCSQL